MDRNQRTRHGNTSRTRTFPARGTWIEIWRRSLPMDRDIKTFPARGTWIEISQPDDHILNGVTFPARGTWIEIPLR